MDFPCSPFVVSVFFIDIWAIKLLITRTTDT
jgi:hypothetical protein